MADYDSSVAKTAETSSTGQPSPARGAPAAAERAPADIKNPVSLPMAALPPAAIIGIAVTGALAGPVWAIAAAALFLTTVGMWVARVTRSPSTALLAGAIGISVFAAATVYYASVDPGSLENAERQSPTGELTRLGGTDFRGANLPRVNLRNANLRAADFSTACLRAADLRGADLTDAIFTGADVSGALVDSDKQTSVARDWPTRPPAPSPCDD